MGSRISTKPPTPRKDSVITLKANLAKSDEAYKLRTQQWEDLTLERDRLKADLDSCRLAWNEAKVENAKLIDKLRELTDSHSKQYMQLAQQYTPIVEDLDNARRTNKQIAWGVSILFMAVLLAEAYRYLKG